MKNKPGRPATNANIPAIFFKPRRDELASASTALPVSRKFSAAKNDISQSGAESYRSGWLVEREPSVGHEFEPCKKLYESYPRNEEDRRGKNPAGNTAESSHSNLEKQRSGEQNKARRTARCHRNVRGPPTRRGCEYPIPNRPTRLWR
ncbi:MAG: hypothetical protein C4326_04415 [Ignavibacteria bacterium]